MPVDFTLIPARGLLLVQGSGFVTIDDTLQATARYERNAAFDPNQKQLIDLSAVTGFERDYPRFMAMQAQKAGRFARGDTQTIVVYLAPTPVAQTMSAMFARSWDGIDEVVALVQQDEARALSLLGQPESSISALLQLAR